MITETELPGLLFFDLETSSEFPSFEALTDANPRKAQLWKTKHDKAKAKDPEKWNSYEESYKAHSPLSAEFGRIVCGSFCYLGRGESSWKIVMKSFHDDEATVTSEVEKVLKPISILLTTLDRAGKNMRLCGHNIKKFDIPWLGKRMMMKNVPVPSQIQTWGKKPWEVNHVDTGELWSFGNWEGYVSLDLLSECFGVDSSKTKMKGEYVGAAFWELKQYEEIRMYCEEDTTCVARICHAWSKSNVPIQ